MEVIKGYVGTVDLFFFDEQENGNSDRSYKEEVLIRQSICHTVEGTSTGYEKRIEIKDSVISKLDLFGAELSGGLTISNSVIGYFRMMDGGYNYKPIIIRNCIFTEEVHLKGARFYNDVIIEGCIFLKGHNFIQDIEYPKGVSRPEYFKVKL